MTEPVVTPREGEPRGIAELVRVFTEYHHSAGSMTDPSADYDRWLHNTAVSHGVLLRALAALPAPQDPEPVTAAPAKAASDLLVDWTWWANTIRIIDGNHDLGAGEMGERIVAVIRPMVAALAALRTPPEPVTAALRQLRAEIVEAFTVDETQDSPSAAHHWIALIDRALSAPSPEPDKP